MKILLFGASGQLGQQLLASCPDSVRLSPLTRSDCDLNDVDAIVRAIAQNDADVVINAAAYTAVDLAETEIALAEAINVSAPCAMAQACALQNLRFVHISSDFVFGEVAPKPIAVDTLANPLSVYGRTKLAGERGIQAIMPDALIIRTSWLYGSIGNNFLRTMLRLMQQGGELAVVADQIGTPTWVNTLGHSLWRLIDAKAQGIFHVTDSGVASWYDFAVAIGEEALAAGLLSRSPKIKPIRSSEYPTPAVRPGFSVLDKSKTDALLGQPAPHWRVLLRSAIAEIS